jgi:GAF domain-containing protein
MTEIKTEYPENKAELYALLKQQLEALTESESHIMANLSNASALLSGALQNINWAGFYLMHDGSLLLGPFQGKTACIRIPVGKGVCGTAVAEDKTQLIADVHQFPSHIACDSASNSEIVVPIRFGGQVVGVLDIDSPEFNRFDEEDKAGLEELVEIIEVNCDWRNTSVKF